jgi:hypothetical protein
MAKIIIDPVGDYDVNWQKALWRASWKDVYIPKGLRGKIKITFDKKTGAVVIKNKKNEKSL